MTSEKICRSVSSIHESSGKYHQAYANYLRKLKEKGIFLYSFHEVSISIIENGIRKTQTYFFHENRFRNQQQILAS